MQHSVPAKMAPTMPKFFAELHERMPISLKPTLSCWRSGRELMGVVPAAPDIGVSYDIDAMNRPNTPPSAKPAPPERTVLNGHDSIEDCICGVVSGNASREKSGGTDELDHLLLL